MRAHPVMIILGVLSAFAFGLLTGRIIPAVDTTAGGGSPDQVLIAPQAREGQEQAPRRAFQEIRNDDADRPEPVEVEGFAFSRLVIQTDTAEPKACIQFSEELDPDTNYRDFIRLTPNVRPALEVAGRSLCILGLSFNRDYTVEIRPGLRSADGEVLERGERVNVAFGDKPAYVGFAGEGVVLPRYEADGLAIETVNIDRVEVEVLRVSDRAIAQKRIVSGGAISEDSYYYAYGDESGDDIGAPVFKGELDVTSQQNETATTVFALGAALPNLKPGAYFVRVRDASKSADRRRPAQAWRWIVYTDMAITTYSGVDGVDVFVRSIETARPVAGVELALIARNNDILARVVTNTEGRARFDGPVTRGSGVLAPRMIMAFGPQDDFAVNDLQRAPLDLSDRNVAGRSTPAAIEGYLYFDRGIYRPGETAHITGLLRDTNTLVSVDRAVTAIVYRPNGAEAFRQRINSLNIGSFNFDFQAPRSAQRGLWRVSVEADGVGVVANETFSVEDFVPQRLEVALVADEKTPLDGASPLALEVRSRFLYGAPASDLPVEAEARLRVDPNPFPQFSGYRYGRASLTFRERFLTLPGAITDGDGAATVRLETGEAPKGLSVPLRVDVVVGVVEPGGRVVRESARIPVRPDEAYLGLRLSKPGGGFGQEEPAEIEAVLLDRAGEALARSIEWRLVEEDYWFDWYRQNGEWRWRRSFRDILVEDGKAETLAEGPVKISRRLDQGSYRLIATDPASGAQTEIRFYVGWRSYASSAEAPDQATVTGPTDPIAPGARARLVLDAPYEGEAIVTVATDKVQLVQRLKIEEGGREILIDTDPSWGSGFYVLANIVTPRDAVDRPVPRRAVGVAYVPFDMGERTLKIGMNAPDVIRPRTKIKLPLSIQGLRRDEPVLLTLAAVDEGILRLTKFVSPAPEKTYYGKRRLGVEIRDDYGRILNANLGAAARFGGDQIGGEGLTVVPTKSIALYSGPVEVDVDGLAEIDLDIPDFNGELRLMAVAWSQSALGSASSPLTVRDPVPALLSLPRFMAPGDKASATLSVDNVEGAEGEYTARLTAAGPVALSETVSFALAPGERKTRTFPFEATGEGIAQITVAVSGPNGESISRTTPIQVRTPFYPVTNRSVATLAPGERFVATDALLAGFTPGSGDVNVSFSRLRGVEPGALLASLYRYPYGCSEQLVSTALPLLYADVLGGASGADPDRAVRPRVQEAVNSLLNRQGTDGAFGLWRIGDRAATPWIGAYVTEFLQRAKSEGYGVPDAALEKAYQALADFSEPNRFTPVNYRRRAYEGPGSNDSTANLRRRAAAYAHYVLARAGRADLSDLRYFHDGLLDATPSPLARAHIAAALALSGDVARAESAFQKSLHVIGFENTGDYYQTALRDVAGVLALASETGRGAVVSAASAAFDQRLKEPERMQTQEKAFVLIASQALLRAAGPLNISVDGERIANVAAPSFSPALRSLGGDGVTYTNLSDGPIFRTVTASGAPLQAPPQVFSGFNAVKFIANRDGTRADLLNIKQNDQLVIAISGQASGERLHPAIVADLLPPGFEIVTVLRPEDGGSARGEGGGPYSWIGPISRAKIAEARDDRFVAAIDVRRERFTFAYVVRAVTPGDFVVPGVVIEDMYRPGVVGRTAASRVQISAANE